MAVDLRVELRGIYQIFFELQGRSGKDAAGLAQKRMRDITSGGHNITERTLAKALEGMARECKKKGMPPMPAHLRERLAELQRTGFTRLPREKVGKTAKGPAQKHVVKKSVRKRRRRKLVHKMPR